MIRPGRADITATSWQSRMASSTSWGHQDDGPGVRVEGCREPGLQVRPGDRVKGAEGLVQQQDVLVRHQGARERDALAHSPRQVRGAVLLEPAQTQPPEQGHRLFSCLPGGHPQVLQRQAGVRQGGPPGQEQVPLGHPGAPLQSVDAAAPAEDGDRPAVRLVQPADQGQQGRLAASARTDDAEAPVPPDVEIQAVEGHDSVETTGDSGHGDPGVRLRRRRPAVRTRREPDIHSAPLAAATVMP